VRVQVWKYVIKADTGACGWVAGEPFTNEVAEVFTVQGVDG